MTFQLSRTSVLLAVLATLGVGVGVTSFTQIHAASSVAAPTAVAVVNIFKVIEALKMTEALTNEQKKEQEELKKQGEAKQASLKTLDDKLKIAGEAQRQELQDKFAEERGQFEAWVKRQQEKMNQTRVSTMMVLYSKVSTEASQMAEKKGYDILLGLSVTNEQLKDIPLQGAQSMINSREVLWAKKSVDITDELIAKMNADFNQRGTTTVIPTTTEPTGPQTSGPTVSLPAPKN